MHVLIIFFFSSFGLIIGPMLIGIVSSGVWAFTVLAISILGMLRAMSKRFSYLSFEVMVFLISSIYITAAIADYALFDNTKQFSVDYLIWIGMIGSLFLIAYALTILKVTIPPPHLERNARNRIDHKAVFYVSILISSLAFIYYVRSAGEMAAAAYLSRAEIYQNKSLALDLIKLTLPISLLISWIARHKSGTSIFSFANILITGMTLYFIGFEVLVFGDRRISLSLILALIILFFHDRKINFVWLFAMIPLAIGTVLFGYFRNQEAGNFDAIVSFLSAARLLNPTNTEFGAFHIVGRTLFEQSTSELMDLTLFAAPATLIPHRIYPDRPQAPSIEFVQNYFVEIYNSGGGLAYNLLIEFFQNFWYFGIIILGSSLAYFIVALSRMRASAHYLYFIIMWNTLFCMRFDVVSLLRSIIISCVIFFIVLYISRILIKPSTNC